MDYETINIKIKMVGGYFIPIQLLVFHSYNQAEMKEFELTNTSVWVFVSFVISENVLELIQKWNSIH